MGGGGSRARQNAMRSAVVVLGSLAFGYLSFRVGFKPYLDGAQEAIQAAESAAASDPSSTGTDPADRGDGDIAPSKDAAVVLRD